MMDFLFLQEMDFSIFQSFSIQIRARTRTYHLHPSFVKESKLLKENVFRIGNVQNTGTNISSDYRLIFQRELHVIRERQSDVWEQKPKSEKKDKISYISMITAVTSLETFTYHNLLTILSINLQDYNLKLRIYPSCCEVEICYMVYGPRGHFRILLLESNSFSLSEYQFLPFVGQGYDVQSRSNNKLNF